MALKQRYLTGVGATIWNFSPGFTISGSRERSNLCASDYEQNLARPTVSDTAETENGGSNAASLTEGSNADAVHVDITSVTKPGVNPSSMLISVT